MVLRKHELEAQLKDENELIRNGVLREENPLDQSEDFNEFLHACRRGDLKRCQELISSGVNINGKDGFDYTPLIIASLCGHYELVQLLLESGALAERNTFQGERCIYNALNDRIRNLLLQYDYSKSTDPLQYWSSHISSLLVRQLPRTSDISLIAASQSFDLHKFLLWSRSPYFRKKLADAPDTATWKLPTTIPVQSFHVILRYLYLGEVPKELADPRSATTEEEILNGIDKVAKQLEINSLWEAILSGDDRRLARQRHQDEVAKAQGEVESFFRENVLKNKMSIETRRVNEVKWPQNNFIFADCLLQADEEQEGEDDAEETDLNGIPIGPVSPSRATNGTRKPRRSVIFPAHKALLIRSPYFETMFSSEFKEAQDSQYLHVIKMDCVPEVLEIILTFLYTEKADCPLDLALDLLYAADMLLLDPLKTKAAVTISTLGSGNNNVLIDRTHSGTEGEPVQGIEMEPINVYDVLHAAWDLRVQRLEEFAARYLAYRLEDYIDDKDFTELVQESASRLKTREETDTIELLDDIRYYLSERFRLRFEDAGLDEMLDDEGEISAEAVEVLELKKNNGDARHADAGEDGLSGRASKDSAPAAAKIQAEDQPISLGNMRTLDGEIAEDEFASDAINYQLLLNKIDGMLDRLKLDA